MAKKNIKMKRMLFLQQKKTYRIRDKRVELVYIIYTVVFIENKIFN